MASKTVKTIGQYDISETVQEYPEGVLYRAFDHETKQSALIKTYYPSLKWSDEALDEFFDRLSFLKFVEHEYLLPILDFGKHNKTPYIVFSDIQAKSLQEYFPSTTINSKEFIGLFYKIAEALDFLHRQDVIHGMLSPENILIEPECKPRLMDYGFSEILKKVLLENMPGDFLNLSISNVKYTSPEQILGRTPTRLSDIYSFGLLFYFGAAGEPLPGGKTAPEIAIFHLKPGEEWFRKETRNLSAGARRFLHRCLRTEPENRYKGFTEILIILKRMANSRVTHLRPIRKSPSPITPKARYLAGVYAGSALIVFFGLIYLWRVFSAPNNSAQIEISPTAGLSLDSDGLTPNPENPTRFPTVQDATPGDQIATESTVPTSQPTAISTSQPIPTLIKPALEGEAVTASHGTITLSNLQNIEEFSRLGYGKPEDVDISPDQALFAIATSAGVFVYNDNNTLNTWIDPQGWATSVQYSPDGNMLAIGLYSGEIQVWDWKNDTQSVKLSGHSAQISKLLFSSNGRYLYSASYDQNVTVWDMQTGQEIRAIPAHSAPVNDISVTDDGRMLASCSSDDFVRIWDLSSGKKLDDFLFTGNCEAVAFSSDGEYLAAGGDTGYLYQWIVKSHLPRTDIVPIKKRIWTIQYIENNKLIFVGMDDGNTRVLNAEQEKYPGTSMAVSIPRRDPKLVDAYGSQFEFDESFAPYGNGTNYVSIQWDGTVKHQATPVWTEYYDSLDELILSSDGSFAATNGKRGLTAVWNVINNQVVFRATSGIHLPAGEPIAPDDSAIIIIIPTSSRNIYQRVSLEDASRKDLSDVVSGGIVSYARNGGILVSGNLNQSKAWDFSSGYEVFITQTRDATCWVTESSNDGEILQVVSAAGVFPIWNKKVENICFKSYTLRSSLFAYSDDYDFLTYIISRTSNELIEGFDAVSNQVVWKYDPPEKITAIASSSDGQIVAIGSQNGKLIFLNGENGQPVFTTTGNFGEVTSIKFSRDGNWIATAGSDGVVRLFSLPINK